MMTQVDRAAARLRRFRSLLFLVVFLWIGLPMGGAAQSGAPRTQASPELPADHWAVEALRRAEALGLIRDYLPAQRRVPRHTVAAALRQAADGAAGDPRYAGLTAGWLARFSEEFPELAAAPAAAQPRSLGQAARIAYVGHAGRAAAGTGVFVGSRTGAAWLPPISEPRGDVSAAAGFTPHLSVLVEPAATPDGLELPGWDVSAGWRSLTLSLGRQPIGYGYARTGGIVLAGTEAVTRVQLQTSGPVRIPGPLRLLGPVSFHGFGGWLSEPRHPGDPYLWGIAASVQPHARFTMSIHRTSIIGGDSIETPLTPRNFFRTFIGHNLFGFENEVFAAQLRYRLPTEGVVPLTVYTEWGAEDAAGAWRDVPGRLYGIAVPAVPGLPQLSLGAEYASFAESCCGNPPWYRHAWHSGGWVVEDRPMGHPLGGEGRQASFFSRAELLDSRVRLDAHAFQRRRSGENLFVPGREGTSSGLEMRGAWRVGTHAEAVASLSTEGGDGWTERSALIGVRAFFR
jgi:hypothetical protein